MAAGDKVFINLDGLELAKKRLLGSIKAIDSSIKILADEYASNTITISAIKSVKSVVSNYSAEILNNINRPELVASITADYKQAYPLQTTYDFADAESAWRASAIAINQWINTNNPGFSVNDDVLTQAEVPGLGVLLADYNLTIDRSLHTF